MPTESRSGRETKDGRLYDERPAPVRTSPKPIERLKVSTQPPEKPAKTAESKLVPDTQPSKAGAAASKRTQGTVPVPKYERPAEKAASSPKEDKTVGDTQPAGDAKLADDAKAPGNGSQTVSPSHSDDAINALQASMDNLSIERR